MGRTKGGLNSKLYVLADAKGRPIHMFLSAAQISDYIGARAFLPSIPQEGALLADRGYDVDWCHNALIELGISPCIPSKLSRTVQIPHDAALYRLRHKIENIFARLKDWRRVAMRDDRRPTLFLSACALAAIVIHWL
jgi:transposase